VAAPLLVADAPFLLYRSFFALPQSITGLEGRPVGALLGSANLLLRAAAELAPRAIVACFGAEAAAYRTELYPPYHAHRPPTPDALGWQFEVAPELFAGFGWASISSPDHEADDLLHSLAQVERAAGGSTLILTGDRDLYQCAGPAVTVLYLKSGRSGFDRVDAAEVRRRYGIEAALVPDFIALRGDPSDGLPGAPGIGAKGAAEILRRHGSLEQALAAVGTVQAPREHHGERPRTATVLREHADELRAFRAIARLRDLEVERPADGETDLAGGAAVAGRFGMGRLAARLERARSLSEL
jgi:DNA polymerase-1